MRWSTQTRGYLARPPEKPPNGTQCALNHSSNLSILASLTGTFTFAPALEFGGSCMAHYTWRLPIPLLQMLSSKAFVSFKKSFITSFKIALGLPGAAILKFTLTQNQNAPPSH
jgi:hypothetical protein